MSNLNRRPSTNASYQVSVHLAKRFQRRFFWNQPISKIIACGDHCLLTDPGGSRRKSPTTHSFCKSPTCIRSYHLIIHMGWGFEHILRSTFSKSFKIIHRKVFIGNKSLENDLGNKYHKPCRLILWIISFKLNSYIICLREKKTEGKLMCIDLYRKTYLL